MVVAGTTVLFSPMGYEVLFWHLSAGHMLEKADNLAVL